MDDKRVIRFLPVIGMPEDGLSGVLERIVEERGERKDKHIKFRQLEFSHLIFPRTHFSMRRDDEGNISGLSLSSYLAGKQGFEEGYIQVSEWLAALYAGCGSIIYHGDPAGQVYWNVTEGSQTNNTVHSVYGMSEALDAFGFKFAREKLSPRQLPLTPTAENYRQLFEWAMRKRKDIEVSVGCDDVCFDATMSFYDCAPRRDISFEVMHMVELPDKGFRVNTEGVAAVQDFYERKMGGSFDFTPWQHIKGD